MTIPTYRVPVDLHPPISANLDRWENESMTADEPEESHHTIPCDPRIPHRPSGSGIESSFLETSDIRCHCGSYIRVIRPHEPRNYPFRCHKCQHPHVVRFVEL